MFSAASEYLIWVFFLQEFIYMVLLINWETLMRRWSLAERGRLTYGFGRLRFFMLTEVILQ
jgi:TRAP-type mannitol/chloroaromatic compound transport system permease small subunit